MGEDALDEEREAVLDFDRKRFDFLREIYTRSEGVPGSRVEVEDIREALGLEEKEFRRVYQRLREEGLIERLYNSPLTYAITTLGANVYEEAIRNQDEPIPGSDLPPVNVMYVGEARNTQIQQGTQGSEQDANFDVVTSELESLLEILWELIDQELEGDEAEAIRAEAEILQAQVESPDPDPGIIGATCSSLKERIRDAIAAGLASGLASEAIQRLDSVLGYIG